MEQSGDKEWGMPPWPRPTLLAFIGWASNLKMFIWDRKSKMLDLRPQIAQLSARPTILSLRTC